MYILHDLNYIIHECMYVYNQTELIEFILQFLGLHTFPVTCPLNITNRSVSRTFFLNYFFRALHARYETIL